MVIKLSVFQILNMFDQVWNSSIFQVGGHRANYKIEVLINHPSPSFIIISSVYILSGGPRALASSQKIIFILFTHQPYNDVNLHLNTRNRYIGQMEGGRYV